LFNRNRCLSLRLRLIGVKDILFMHHRVTEFVLHHSGGKVSFDTTLNNRHFQHLVYRRALSSGHS